jgi:hypothetical protein
LSRWCQVSIGVLEEEEAGFAGDVGRVRVPAQKAKLKVPRFLNRLLGLPMVSVHGGIRDWSICVTLAISHQYGHFHAVAFLCLRDAGRPDAAV